MKVRYWMILFFVVVSVQLHAEEEKEDITNIGTPEEFVEQVIILAKEQHDVMEYALFSELINSYVSGSLGQSFVYEIIDLLEKEQKNFFTVEQHEKYIPKYLEVLNYNYITLLVSVSTIDEDFEKLKKVLEFFLVYADKNIHYTEYIYYYGTALLYHHLDERTVLPFFLYVANSKEAADVHKDESLEYINYVMENLSEQLVNDMLSNYKFYIEKYINNNFKQEINKVRHLAFINSIE